MALPHVKAGQSGADIHRLDATTRRLNNSAPEERSTAAAILFK